MWSKGKGGGGGGEGAKWGMCVFTVGTYKKIEKETGWAVSYIYVSN